MAEYNVILTGATGGIGRAIAKELLSRGSSLVLTGRSEKKLEELVAELCAASLPDSEATIHRITCDLSSEANRRELMDFVESRPENFNVLINNAGINEFGMFTQQSETAIAQQLQVNALYPLLLTRQVLGYFEKRSVPGQIINIGSTFGSIGYPGFTAYSASKFALRGASEALAREYADTDIRIRYFSPRATSTDLNSSNVVLMNQELNVAMDTPETVAKELADFINADKRTRFLGWPEKFFVSINQLLPEVVSNSLKKNLPVIRKYAEVPS